LHITRFTGPVFRDSSTLLEKRLHLGKKTLYGRKNGHHEAKSLLPAAVRRGITRSKHSSRHHGEETSRRDDTSSRHPGEEQGRVLYPARRVPGIIPH